MRRKITAPYVMLILLLAILVTPSAAVFAAEAHSASSQAQQKLQTEQIATLKLFYEKRLTDMSALEGIFPKNWLVEDANLSKVRAHYQELLADAIEQQSSQQEEASPDLQLESKAKLLQLKLQWLNLSRDERQALLAELSIKQMASVSEQNSKDNIANAQIAEIALTESTSTLKNELNNTTDEREQRLFSIRLQLDDAFRELTQNQKSLGKIQLDFSEHIQENLDLRTNISEAIEDENFTSELRKFVLYRATVRDRLHEANDRLWTPSNFTEFYFSTITRIKKIDDSAVKIRDSDNEKVRDLIYDIQEKRLLLASQITSFDAEKSALTVKALEWELQNRSQLLELRSQLIQRIISDRAFVINNKEPVAVEIETVATSVSIWFWKKQFLTKHSTASEKKALRFNAFTHLLKLAALLIVIAWLFMRRLQILLKLRQWRLDHLKNPKFKTIGRWAFNIFKDLYVFIILLVFGQVIIDFTASIGFESARNITPIFNHIIIFFLLSGLIHYMVSLLSQREPLSKKPEEQEAIEVALELFPKIYLYYWLISGVIGIVLTQMLGSNLLQLYIQTLLQVFALVAVYISIKRNIKQWRLVSENINVPQRWRNFSARAANKWWEPALLILSGGIGVYRIVWAMLLMRFEKMEMTRSFQAMLSRAILERQHRQSGTDLSSKSAPEHYWDAFDFRTPSQVDWHVPRPKPETLLEEAYSTWLTTKMPTRVLINGDRGTGKSELLADLMRRHDLQVNRLHLEMGDNTLETITMLLARLLLNTETTETTVATKESLIAAIILLPPSVIVVENLENSIIRKVGGFDAFSLLMDIVLQTSRQHMWIASCTSYAWTIAQQAIPGANCFTDKITLSGMTEADLQTLILNRQAEFPLFPLDFSQLRINASSKADETSNPYSSEQEAEEIDKAKNLYFRILWDYTKGNPRQALYYWKTSVSWADDKTVVTLFAVPEQNVLEVQQDTTLMILAALIEHNGLSLSLLTQVMNTSESTLRRRIEELSPYSIIYSQLNDDGEIWHVESFWARAVENYLIKRQFLFRGENA